MDNSLKSYNTPSVDNTCVQLYMYSQVGIVVKPMGIAGHMCHCTLNHCTCNCIAGNIHMYTFVHVQWNLSLSAIRTLALVPIVVILYKTTLTVTQCPNGVHNIEVPLYIGTCTQVWFMIMVFHSCVVRSHHMSFAVGVTDYTVDINCTWNKHPMVQYTV